MIETVTTQNTAKMIYHLIEWINPYEICSLDKNEIIESIMNESLENNISSLKQYIADCSNINDLLDDTELMKQYLKIVKQLRK